MRNALFKNLPEMPEFEGDIRRAPKRSCPLSPSETKLALKNALRYIPSEHHETMAKEFLGELASVGRIYGYRFRPKGNIKAKSIEAYRGRTIEGKACQLMIQNNLDFDVALYPYELVTYGETGQVFQNWMQYQLTMAYLEELSSDQTLVLHSGHPVGLFRSHKMAPRVITTNGLMVGIFDDPVNFNRAQALGVANYGQMTAGGWMYIGPQGIVHGTYNTLVIAARQKLGLAEGENLKGKVFVSSGLGGMSGAQPKAADIAGAVSIIAEVDPSRIETRHSQGWVQVVAKTAKDAIKLAQEARDSGKALSIAFQGNIIELLEAVLKDDFKVDLLTDQTSCHAVYDGGYCPVGLTFEERTDLLASDKDAFKEAVDRSLVQHFALIRALTEKGTYFFDYGNSFLKAVYDAGVDEVAMDRDPRKGFIYPSYVEDILGPELFDYGYGPFRWVCLSGKDADLQATDEAAAECILGLRQPLRYQDRDNYQWVKDAEKNALVVGSKARILYQDAKGRTEIALKFNRMVREGRVGPIMLGRDHHDTSGTDSPFRETSNIKDGSNIMAEMATHCFAGNAARGMSLVALHNGGGVGIGKSINGGFGMVLDGSERVDQILASAMPWDVMGGVARRAWAGNPHAIETSQGFSDPITIPFLADDELLNRLC